MSPLYYRRERKIRSLWVTPFVSPKDFFPTINLEGKSDKCEHLCLSDESGASRVSAFGPIKSLLLLNLSLVRTHLEYLMEKRNSANFN